MTLVRREIRDISVDEWDKVVEAIWIMKTKSDSDGKSDYGQSFVSYDTMILKHMDAAFDPRGDQAHFGKSPSHQIHAKCSNIQERIVEL